MGSLIAAKIPMHVLFTKKMLRKALQNCNSLQFLMKPYAYQICGQPEGKYAFANESIQKGIILLEKCSLCITHL